MVSLARRSVLVWYIPGLRCSTYAAYAGVRVGELRTRKSNQTTHVASTLAQGRGIYREVIHVDPGTGWAAECSSLLSRSMLLRNWQRAMDVGLI